MDAERARVALAAGFRAFSREHEEARLCVASAALSVENRFTGPGRYR